MAEGAIWGDVALQRFLLISMPLPTGISTESMSPAARTRAR
jgi:hypothetical protein